MKHLILAALSLMMSVFSYSPALADDKSALVLEMYIQGMADAINELGPSTQQAALPCNGSSVMNCLTTCRTRALCHGCCETVYGAGTHSAAVCRRNCAQSAQEFHEAEQPAQY